MDTPGKSKKRKQSTAFGPAPGPKGAGFAPMPSTPPKRLASTAPTPPGGTGGFSSLTAAGASSAHDMAPPPPKRSKRVAEQQERDMAKLVGLAADAGAPVSGAAHDLTPHLFAPMKSGNDGRLYVDTGVRRGMERQIESTRASSTNLASSNLPAWAKAIHSDANTKGKTLHRVSDRSDRDGFRSGQDLTFTSMTGLDTRGTRGPQDTPEPRSPNPYTTNEELHSTSRYERTHQSAFRFTGLPGSTVHAPTQANQVADTHLERFVAGGEKGSFLARRDTYDSSHLVGVRQNKGKIETMQASYQRRATAKPKPSAGLSPMPKGDGRGKGK